MNLLLFSASFPYDVATENTFLQPEVDQLHNYFERIILIPRLRQGKMSSLHPKVSVDDSYALFLEKLNKSIWGVRSLFSSHFYMDMLTRPGLLLSLSAVKRIIYFLIYAYATQKWLNSFIKRTSTDINKSIFYTYWFNDSPMGIGMVKKRFPEMKVVSRAHGYDLYEERFHPPYWPCRRTVIAMMDYIFPDSDAGTRYLRDRFPEYRETFHTSRLGVKDPGFLSQPSKDTTYRIVSCSRFSPEKRIHLIIEGITEAARRRPHQLIEWHHFGNGEERLDLQAKADSIFPNNVKGIFAGYSTQKDLYDYYRINPIDVFINVSESEGTPVSIMEAISCGIPVIATSVGGNTEIVSAENGFLIGANPTADEIGRTLLNSMDELSGSGQKREASRRIWSDQYNADKNFPDFASRLIHIQ